MNYTNNHIYCGEKASEANAQLISSAPDLLEACKLALVELDSCQDTFFREYTLIERLQQAITKAEGVKL